MTKHKNEEKNDQNAEEVRPDNEPTDDRGDASRAEDDPKRVANNGEVHDAGNSGLIGEDYTNAAQGQADKPNG